MLPNWLHIGAAKCASSWLWRVCIGHPEIYVPETPDNVNFFMVHYQRGLGWYQQTYFADYNGEPTVGEFSNSYMCYRPALERIARDLPDVRLTMTLRHPVERAFLSWSHLHLKKKPTGLDMRKGIGIPFEKALHHHGHGWFRLWVDPGFYARHLDTIFEFFPRERVCVMLHEDLAVDEQGFLRRFFEFLEVDADFPSPLCGQEINPDPDDVWDYLNPDVRAELVEVYRPDVERLAEALGRDLSHWLE